MKKYYIHKNYSLNKPAIRNELIIKNYQNNNNDSKQHEYRANFPPNLVNSQNTGIRKALNTNPYKRRRYSKKKIHHMPRMWRTYND